VLFALLKHLVTAPLLTLCLLLQYLIQSCARGGRRIVEDMCYEIRRAEACVDKADHHTLVNAGEKASVDSLQNNRTAHVATDVLHLWF
jgi:hypothetical protein